MSNALNNFGTYHGEAPLVLKGETDSQFKGDSFFFYTLMSLDDGTDLGDYEHRFDDMFQDEDQDSNNIFYELSLEEDDWGNVDPEFEESPPSINLYYRPSAIQFGSSRIRAAQTYHEDDDDSEEAKERRSRNRIRRIRNDGHRKCNKRKTIRRMIPAGTV